MIILDTSALIRFFTRDVPIDAEKVKKLIEGGEDILIPDVVFPEIEYVLEGSYKTDRKKIYQAFDFLRHTKNIKISNEVREAVSIYQRSKLDMADCIIAASSTGNKLFSFDKKLISTV